MKKLALLTISLLLLSSIALAHEASIYYPLTEEQGQAYWHLKQIRLYWTGDDYAVDLDLTPVVIGRPLDVKEAWKSLNLFHSRISTLKSIDLAIGKIVYPFGNVSSLASKNISILQPKTFDSDLMAKLSGNICNTHHLDFYWADKGNIRGTTDAPATIGFRAATTYIKGADIGASLRIHNLFNGDFDNLLDYGIDLGYTLKDMVKLDLQAYNLDDGDDNTDDIDLWFLATHVKGFQIPIIQKIRPYFGFFTKPVKNRHEYNIIYGINITPTENAFIKLEYNIDSLDETDIGFTNCSDALALQVGFTF